MGDFDFFRVFVFVVFVFVFVVFGRGEVDGVGGKEALVPMGDTYPRVLATSSLVLKQLREELPCITRALSAENLRPFGVISTCSFGEKLIHFRSW